VFCSLDGSAFTIGVGERGTCPPPLGSYPAKSELYKGKFENIQANLKMKIFFLREHTTPMRKRGGNFREDQFFFRDHTNPT